MSLISTTPWIDQTPARYDYNWLVIAGSVFRTRQAIEEITRRWTCDKDGGSIQASPGTGYEIAYSDYVRDARFKLFALPTSGPAGEWVEIWQKFGSLEIWNGSSWVAL